MDNQDKVKEELNLQQYRTHRDKYKNNYKTIDNIILAHNSRRNVTKMIEETGIKYDYIIFLRPDVKYIQKFYINHLWRVKGNKICVPNFASYGRYKINDRFCICGYNTYKLYGDMFDKILSISKMAPLCANDLDSIIYILYYHNHLYVHQLDHYDILQPHKCA